MVLKMVGRYEIESKIGGNERGAVYKARDTESNRDVALKLLAGQSLFTMTTQKKFAQQMAALKALSHPALLPLLDFGAEDNRPFIVMPLMQGNLSEKIAAQPMEVDAALAVCRQIGDAFDYAAANNHFHLDLKPNNILFDEHDHPFVADLGLVQVINSLSAANTPQVNPYYMSPEQVRRRPMTSGAHVYSLAAMLFHMLTGQVLFPAATETVASFKHTSERPRSIRQLRGDLTKGFDAVMERALEKRPEERFPNCRTFVQQLVSAQGGALSAHEVRAQEFRDEQPRIPQPRASRPVRATSSPGRPGRLQQYPEIQRRVVRILLGMGATIALCIALSVILAILLSQ